MKIYIKHLPNTLNYGSMMMGENLIYYLEKKLKKHKPEFYTDTEQDYNIERLKQATRYEKIYMDQIFKYKLFFKNVKFIRYIERRFNEKKAYRKASNYYDVIIILGGDDFSEIYFNIPKDNLVIKNHFKRLKALNKAKKFYMLGQTVGPYTGIRKKWAKECFKNIQIYSRDDKSAKYMKEELDKDVLKSRDLAFLDLCLQEEHNENYQETLKKYDLIENEYITIVGTGLINLYSKNEEDVIDSFVKIIKMIKRKYPNKKLVWLSHVVTRNENSSDNTLLEKINKKHSVFINKNMIVIKKEILPVEARMILGYGYFTITCRMHAAVSTFQMKKPAICLSYSPKYKGVISDGLDMNELVIESKSEELWQGPIVDLVTEKIDYVENNYINIIEKIDTKVEACKKVVNETIDQISKEISETNK